MFFNDKSRLYQVFQYLINFINKKKILYYNNKFHYNINFSKHEERKIVENQIKNHLEDFVSLRVSDIMIPRSDMIVVPSSIDLEKLCDTFIEYSFTRIPVYNKIPDEIIGFVHLKDFLPYVRNNEGFDIHKIIRKIIYIPRSTKCIDLLIKMRKETTHISVVIDEYGGTEGLIMIELLIEKIVGDIRDEHDIERPEQIQIHKISNNSYMLDARTSIEKIKSSIEDIDWLHNQNGEYETIGGFVLSHLGRMPTKGEVIKDDNRFEIEIIDTDMRKIKMIRLTVFEN
ncbi:hemolysin family protein [Lyticum sinuosum]|uniref:HlyC/CorC family transporter n=1 Tax=Lyticum sinuosum TaxID=1332059 RepID=A0AAE4VKL1_9RICK|nr:hemolysin family protein [Lyticum sinuosum]MDZ5760964.1 HlyC/CorC family transporter [Lyticum sinuosum]